MAWPSVHLFRPAGKSRVCLLALARGSLGYRSKVPRTRPAASRAFSWPAIRNQLFPELPRGNMGGALSSKGGLTRFRAIIVTHDFRSFPHGFMERYGPYHRAYKRLLYQVDDKLRRALITHEIGMDICFHPPFRSVVT